MPEVIRATFEEVQRSQEELIFGETGIDKLIELNETIAPSSRNLFFRNLAFALLGLGIDHEVKIEYDGFTDNLGYVSEFARKIAYYSDTDDKKQELVLRGKNIRIPNKVLWKALRESLYKPMDAALTLALRYSAEIPAKRGGSYSIGTDGKEKKHVES